jgi:hypothetical protein
VTIGAGIPALVATSASAVVPTGITLSPDTATSGVNTCVAFTATVTPAPSGISDSAVVDVLISQDNPAYGSGAVTTAATLTFCDPDGAGAGTTPNHGTATTNFSSSPSSPAPAGPAGAGAANAGANACVAPNQSQTVTTTTRCEAQFETTGGTAQVTFGVQTDKVGTVNITAYYDQNANRTPETFEPQDSSVLTVQSGTATALVCTPETQSAPRQGVADYSCTASAGTLAATGSIVHYVVTKGPDLNQTGQCGSAATPGTPTTTNNQGQAVCRVTNGGTLGTDTVTFYVEQNGQSGPQTGEPNDSSTATFAGSARNIACAPKDQTIQSAGVSTVTCTVTDANGNPVAPSVNGANQPGGIDNNANGTSTYVTFTSTGAGRFVDGSTTKTVQIGANGQAVIQTTSQVNEIGDQTVKATLSDVNGNTYTTTGPEECANASGVTQSGVAPAPTTAGNCSDTVTRHYTASGSPSPSPSGTGTPNPSPTNSNGGRGTLSTSTPDIQPNIQAVLTASGLTANAQYELMCYSRPSTTYFVARSAATSAGSSTLEFRLLPGTNTRCYVRPQGNDSLASNSVVINVHTTLSLSTVRTGIRTYIFQGRNLPRRSGQLITLYRIANGQEIRTSNLTTDASGIYRVTRTFTGTGTFQFRVRTSQTLTNAPGASNIITVTVH